MQIKFAFSSLLFCGVAMMTPLVPLLSNAASSIPVQNKIGWSLYRSEASLKENLFLSPSSLYTALALTFEGSSGPLRADASRFLGLPEKEGPFRPSLVSQIKELGKNPHIRLTSASSIWLDQKSAKVKARSPEFEKSAADFFQAQVQEISFSPTRPAVDAINEWSRQATQDLIKEIVAPSHLEGQVAVILNAIYFKGSWLSKFEKSSTSSGKFLSPEGELVRSFMDQTREHPYFENASVQMSALPYQGGELEMVLVIPREGKSLDELEDTLSAETLNSWMQELKPETVHVRMPKFEIKWGAKNLKQDLAKAGMPVAGDFSRLGIERMTLSSVLHKTVIKVDEEGSEAAAVTAVATRVLMKKPEPRQFILNRPFLFVIRDRSHNNWHFLGRVLKP